MKKKLLTNVAMTLSCISFSFYRMEGPYDNINYPEILPHQALQNDPVLKTIFLYDKNTHLRLEYTFENKENGIDLYPAYRYRSNIRSMPIDINLITEDTITPSKFFTCKFKYDKTFWDSEKFMHRYMYLAPPYGDYDWINYYSVVKQNITSSKKEYENIVNISSRFWVGFWVGSRLCINDIQDVVFRKYVSFNEEVYKDISLQTSLKKYFNTFNFYTNFANAYAKYQKFVSNSSSSIENDRYFIKYIEPLLVRLNNPILSDESFKLLNESKILTLWCLVPDELGRESQLIGLAEDKEGHLFHWATDLKNDISILFPKKDPLTARILKQTKKLIPWIGKELWLGFEKYIGLKGLY